MPKVTMIYIMDINPNIMANENQEQTVKHSDFSIDHILNRAGSSFVNSVERTVPCDRIGENVDRFQWLQCSRYCPPRVSRIHRKDVQKRQLGRHPRIPFTSYQLSVLEQKFKDSPYLSSEEVIVLSRKLQLADIRVKIWFQNRRARERREKSGMSVDTKEERKPSDHSVNNNRLLSTLISNVNNVDSTKGESPNQNNLLTIKSEANSPPLDFSTNSILPLRHNGIFDSGCVSSPYFISSGVPFFVPNVNFNVNNKDKDVNT